MYVFMYVHSLWLVLIYITDISIAYYYYIVCEINILYIVCGVVLLFNLWI